MGVAASAARSQLKKPLKYYNVEERAMKVISRDKPKPAPPHPAMKKVMEGIVRGNPTEKCLQLNGAGLIICFFLNSS